MMKEDLQKSLSKFQPLLSLNRLQLMLLLLIPELNLMQRANCKPIASRSQAPAETYGKLARRKDLQRHFMLAQLVKTSANISRPPTTISQAVNRKRRI